MKSFLAIVCSVLILVGLGNILQSTGDELVYPNFTEAVQPTVEQGELVFATSTCGMTLASCPNVLLHLFRSILKNLLLKSPPNLEGPLLMLL